jgi:hypothetical protein
MSKGRDATVSRSGERCESMLALDDRGHWTRCGRGPIHVHHMLRRSQGGDLLDDFTDHHLIALCPWHHQEVHKGNGDGMLITGYVITDSITGRPVYTGPDEYLSKEFGA